MVKNAGILCGIAPDVGGILNTSAERAPSFSTSIEFSSVEFRRFHSNDKTTIRNLNLTIGKGATRRHYRGNWKW